MKCFIYARVSTKDKGQDPENQMIVLREYAARSGWEIAGEYVDQMSGSTDSRPALDRLMADAAARKADILLVWALDRLTRRGVLDAFQRLEMLSSYGVRFESYTESHFRTTGPTGELMIAIAAWIAKQERVRLSDRVKAGLARASAAGRKGGQPKKLFDRARARELREAGVSYRKIGALLGVPHTTVRDACCESLH
jgi:DNA invertase Pin-like site-specific DNA recombinase